jgi:hypothetical protein
LPKKPGDVELKVMKEMFEASVDGDAFDMERWGQYFKPAGYGGRDNAEGKGATAAVAKAAPAPATVDDEDPPFEQAVSTPAKVVETPKVEETPTKSEAGSRAQDILAMIRNRQKSE